MDRFLMQFLPALALCLAMASPVRASDARAPAFVEKRADAALVGALRKGGYVLYMRHGLTDNTRPDRVPSVDLADCSTQRPLSDAGRELMKRIGRSIREARVPLGRVLASPMCRTRESALLAVGERFEPFEPLMYSANMTTEDKKPRIEALRKLLAEAPAPGTNTLLVAHAPNLADLIDYFVKPEGTMVVFAPRGAGRFEYLGSIHPDDWAKLR